MEPGTCRWDSHTRELRKYGLLCALTSSHSLDRGLNDPSNHHGCIERIEASVDTYADVGFPVVLVFSGLRNGMSDEVEIENAVAGLKRISSPRMKFLFDIYRVLIMQGDIISRITRYSQYIGHFRTSWSSGTERDQREAGIELSGDSKGHCGGRLRGIRGT